MQNAEFRMKNFNAQISTNTGLETIAIKVERDERLDFEDGVKLFSSYDLLGIGKLAAHVKKKKVGDKVFFVNNRHINQTNICVCRCKFCAFSRDEGDADAYTLSLDQIIEKAGASLHNGITELHIVGGLNPKVSYDFYLKMLRELCGTFPDVHIQAFTAVEVDYFAKITGKDLKTVLKELKEAGLGSLPGGGAEVFSSRVRGLVCPNKISGERWLEVMRSAHEIGMKSNATMLYGHVETVEDRVDHLLRLRELQDETGGFQAFIPLAFHPKNTGLEDTPLTTGFDDLKMLAISRLMLDNFDHIKAFWIMLGLKLAQISLEFGVDDMDGTVVEEKITHSAGAETEESITKDELIRLIREAGGVPVERDTLYNILWERK